MVLPNQVCLIVKFYNNRPELLPDSNGFVLDFKIVPLAKTGVLMPGAVSPEAIVNSEPL